MRALSGGRLVAVESPPSRIRAAPRSELTHSLCSPISRTAGGRWLCCNTVARSTTIGSNDDRSLRICSINDAGISPVIRSCISSSHFWPGDLRGPRTGAGMVCCWLPPREYPTWNRPVRRNRAYHSGGPFCLILLHIPPLPVKTENFSSGIFSSPDGTPLPLHFCQARCKFLQNLAF